MHPTWTRPGRRRRYWARFDRCCAPGAQVKSMKHQLPRAFSKRFVWTAAGLLTVLSCLAAAPWFFSQSGAAARRHWKDKAIPLIGTWADDQNRRAQEIGFLTNRTADKGVIVEGWLTDKMILMESGEWLVYRSHCSKEAPHLVSDIFLAKGSRRQVVLFHVSFLCPHGRPSGGTRDSTPEPRHVCA